MHNTNFSTPQDVEKFHQSLGLSNSFCVAPFTTLLFEPDGQVGACRHKGCEFPVGHLKHQTLEEIWNGSFIQKWRNEFLEGKPSICKTEVHHVKCHQCPSYGALIHKADLQLKQIKKPLRIAFNFNGHCNLECQMCHIWQKPNGLYDQIGFWDQLPEVITDLEEVELLSGEPFIQKDTYRLIQLISGLRPETRWTFTTNANWKFSPYISEQLDKISIKHIIVSLDSLLEKNYQVIRRKGNLKLALQTLKDIEKYQQHRLDKGLSGFDIHVNFLIQKDNWEELGHFQNFAEETKYKVFRTFLREPSEYSLLHFNEDKRKEILHYYLSNLSPNQLKHSVRIIKPLIASLNKLDQIQFYLLLKDLLNER